ncbi:phage antirepressor [Exiguobacterium profundum]|uniref:phage antirepressor n=1 Tax=Exiguobacterium profundum TaxID=307643 RepID=UPI002AA93771|nr:phage antirepressor KilAC domain-containing protein [Exiguobacterium profundum]
MNQLTKTFEGRDIRVVGEGEKILFVASDVAKALGYKEPHKAVSRHCKGDGMFRPVIDKLGRDQEMRVIRESDVYRLVTNSKLPAAEAFEMWVMEEVLPSIRKDGAYVAAQPGETPEEIMAKGLLAAQSTIERLKREREVAATKLEEQKPKVLFAEAVSTSQTSILIGQLAKLITQNGHSIGQNRLFEWLRQNNYLGKSGQHRNEPTQYSMERGWFEVLERTNHNPDGSVRITRTTKVTGKGQIYFINKFLSN